MTLPNLESASEARKKLGGERSGLLVAPLPLFVKNVRKKQKKLKLIHSVQHHSLYETAIQIL